MKNLENNQVEEEEDVPEDIESDLIEDDNVVDDENICSDEDDDDDENISSDEDDDDENISSDEDDNGTDLEDVDLENEKYQDSNIDIYSKSVKNIQEDIDKGLAVKKQLDLWDDLLESRIKLQKGVSACNRLYQNQDMIDFHENLELQEKQAVKRTLDSLRKLSMNLLELQTNLMLCSNDDNNKSNGNIESTHSANSDGENDLNFKRDDAEPPAKKKKKLSLNELAQQIEKSRTDFQPMKNSVIQMWNDKTKLTHGRSTKAGDFSGFDQPTLTQIDHILSDKDRLLTRTRTKRSKYRIFGKEDNDEIIEDPEIFDDDDFYHKLLRDLIDKKSNDVSDPKNAGKQWIELQKLRTKMKRKIDTRATKGRKLRYTVHNKLVCFMAPIPNIEGWSEPAEKDLHKSLFGKKL